MSLSQACEHLFPGAIKTGRIRLQDDSNGLGPYIAYFDPALGTQPTQDELDAAEIAYLPPSILQGGEREPMLAELEVDLRKAYDFYFSQVQKKVRKVAMNAGYFEMTQDSKGNYTKTGSMEKAAKYAHILTGPFRARCIQLLQWESDVWEYLIGRWQLIDPRGDFTGFDGQTPPTWSQLENDIDTEHPEP